MGVWQKCSKTQGSKKILREMNEGRLRSLEILFFFYGRNGEIKKKNQEEEEGE